MFSLKEKVLRKITRRTIKKILTDSEILTLNNSFPDLKNINLTELGLYLHVPFCRRPCLYCPYFKETFEEKKAVDYKNAVLKEIDYYEKLLKNKKINSFYIGGGTPTTMIDNGLEDIIKSIKKSYHINCKISSEAHPNDITPKMIEKLHNLDIKNVSMGIESFDDTFLKIIDRPYKSQKAKNSTKLLTDSNFECINIDIMFGLPNQKVENVKEDIKTALSLGVDQISAYPIFTFPHTKLNQRIKECNAHLPGILERRKMLKEIEKICYDAGLKRTSVWAFTKEDKTKYSSVTIPHYIGLGAGAGSLIPGYFYLNTFSIKEYVNWINNQSKPPVALTIDFSQKEEMIHWLYWRIYETKIYKKDFYQQFKKDFDKEFGKLFSILEFLGLCKNYEEKIIMTDKGNYWIHVLQNVFSLDFIGNVWSKCLSDTWPDKLELI